MNRNTGTTNGLVDQAKQTATNVATTAKEGVTHQVEQRIDQTKEKALDKLDTVSGALRGASEKLEGTGPLPDLAERAADGIDRVVHYFENKSLGEVLGSVESFARREPALFLGGAVALGIFAGRFLKSSAHREDGGGSYDEELSADDLEDDWESGGLAVGGPVAEEPMRAPIGATTKPMGAVSTSTSSDLGGATKTKPGL